MKSKSTTPAWLERYQHRKLGRATLIALTLAEIVQLKTDEDAKRQITGDTIIAAAFLKVGGQVKFAMAFLDEQIKPGEAVPMIDFTEMGSDVVPLASFFATGNGTRYVGFGANPEAIDGRYIKAVGDLFVTRTGVYMNPAREIADLRLVGDTMATAIINETRELNVLKNVVVLGFAPAKNVVVARSETGGLMFQSVAKLASSDVIDNVTSWQSLQGIHDGDIFRVGRLVPDGNSLLAPVTAQYDGSSKNGELVISLASARATVDYNDLHAFPITTVPITDDKPTATRTDHKRDPLGLITYDGAHGLEMKTLNVAGEKGPYQRYTRAAVAQQLSA